LSEQDFSVYSSIEYTSLRKQLVKDVRYLRRNIVGLDFHGIFDQVEKYRQQYGCLAKLVDGGKSKAEIVRYELGSVDKRRHPQFCGCEAQEGQE